MSYGPNLIDGYRRAGYLRRPHPQGREASRPAGAETRPSTTLVINLKTAKALGLEIPAHPDRPRRRGDRISDRRAFIGLIGGAVAWPLAARAQQPHEMRRIGVLIGSAGDTDDTDIQVRLGAFRTALQQLGWF